MLTSPDPAAAGLRTYLRSALALDGVRSLARRAKRLAPEESAA